MSARIMVSSQPLNIRPHNYYVNPMIDIVLRQQIKQNHHVTEIASIRHSYTSHIETIKRAAEIIDMPLQEWAPYRMLVNDGMHILVWEGSIVIDKLFDKTTYLIKDPIKFKTEIYVTLGRSTNGFVPHYFSMYPAFGVHFFYADIDGKVSDAPVQICLGDMVVSMKSIKSLKEANQIADSIAKVLTGVNLSSIGDRRLHAKQAQATGDIGLLMDCNSDIIWLDSMMAEGRIQKIL